MNLVTTSNNTPVTMTSLDLVDKEISELLSDPVKDYEWYFRAFEFVDNNECLKKCRGVQKALIMSVSSLFCEHQKRVGSLEKVVNSLYIMESASMGAVKVGRTWDSVEKRALQIKVGCPDIRVVAVFENEGALEPVIHRQLKEFCVGGEWFSISHEVASKIIQEAIKGGSK